MTVLPKRRQSIFSVQNDMLDSTHLPHRKKLPLISLFLRCESVQLSVQVLYLRNRQAFRAQDERGYLPSAVAYILDEQPAVAQHQPVADVY